MYTIQNWIENAFIVPAFNWIQTEDALYMHIYIYII